MMMMMMMMMVVVVVVVVVILLLLLLLLQWKNCIPVELSPRLASHPLPAPSAGRKHIASVFLLVYVGGTQHARALIYSEEHGWHGVGSGRGVRGRPAVFRPGLRCHGGPGGGE